MDQQWCIENQEDAIEYFKEKQAEHSVWENNLNTSRQNKKELGELYWQIRGLIKKFNENYSETISTKKELDNLEEELKKGSVTENVSLDRKGKLTTKLTQSFQGLVNYHEEIKNKIPQTYIKEFDSDKDVQREIELNFVTKIKEIKEPCEREREKLRRELDLSTSDKRRLEKQREDILGELDYEIIKMLKSKGII